MLEWSSELQRVIFRQICLYSWTRVDMLVGVHIIRCNAVIYLYYDATVLVVMHYKYG